MGGLSALQLSVPAVDPLLGRLRSALPPGGALLDPGHISFGYPWLPPTDARAVLDRVAQIIAAHDAIEVDLLGPRRFPPDAKGRTTVFLEPVPDDAIRALASAVSDTSGHPIADFTPHCSLFRLPDGIDPSPLERAVLPHVPLTVRLHRVEFHVHDRRGWTTERVMPVGTARTAGT